MFGTLLLILSYFVLIDTRFYQFKGEVSVQSLCQEAKIDFPDTLRNRKICHIKSLEAASSGDLTFFHHASYAEKAGQTKASIVLTHPSLVGHLPQSIDVLVAQEPLKVLAIALPLVYQVRLCRRKYQCKDGAYISESAVIGKQCVIGPGCVISDDVFIGDHVSIGPGCFIGRGVHIGDSCVIGSQVTLAFSLLGNRVTIKPGARIGQAGFGFFLQKNSFRERISQMHLGRVILEEDVEIGANTTIDRGSLRDTCIGASSRIDNLVQIGHNVTVGKGVVVAAQTGISGSVSIGSGAVLGGQVGVAGHIVIGEKVRIAGQSGVVQSVKDNAVVSGFPAGPVLDWHRKNLFLSRAIKK